MGQLGNGTTTNASKFRAVTGLGATFEISAGGAHTCAVIATGHAQCFGDNTNGQHGNGTTASSTVPVPVTGL